MISIESSVDNVKKELSQVGEEQGESLDEKYHDKFGLDYEDVIDFRNH